MKKKKISISIAICFAMLWGLIYAFAPVPAHAATTVNLYPTADCYITGGVTTNNNVLKAQDGYWSYLLFDLNSIPAGATINTASLEIGTIAGGGCPSGVYVYQASENWTETNALPGSISGAALFTTGSLGEQEWYSLTDQIPTAVRGEYAVDKTISFTIRPKNTYSNAMFYSRETSYKPYLKVTYDIVPKMISAVRNSDNQIAVNLSVSSKNLNNSGNGGFTVTQTGNTGITYTVSSTAQGTSDKQVLLNIPDMGISAKEGVTVTFATGIIQEIATNAYMATDSTGVNVTPWDTTAPIISSTSDVANDNTFMDINFSEGVYTLDNGTGGLTASDFALTFNQNSGTATGVSISSVKKTDGTALSGGESAVRAFFNVTGTPSGIETIEIKPANASAIYDKAGNAMLTTQTTGFKTLKDQLPPTMLSAARNSDTQITVTLSENCTDLAKTNSGGFTVSETSSPAISYAVTAIAQGATQKQVVLTVADMGVSGKEGVNVTYTAGGNGTVKDTSVNANAMATNSTGVAIAAWDTTPPAISSGALAANNAYIDVSMSEGVYTADNGTGALTPSDFALNFLKNAGNATGVSISSVKKPDNALEASASALSGGESAVRVFLNITGTPSGIETIEIKPASATAIYDKAGNAMLATQTTGVKALNDKLPPTTTSAALNSNTKITLGVSETCTDIAKNNDGGFTIEQTGTPSITYAVNSVSEGSIILNTVDMGVSAKEGVTLKYTPGGNGTIKDSAGNLMTSFTTTFAAWDTTPPAITTTSAVAANNAYIDVSMSEGVYAADNGTGGLTPSAFALTFTKNGGTATGVSISSVKKPDNALEASASALSGEETVVRVFLNITGTPSGIETIVIKPANTSAIYDKAGNAMLTTQTTGAKTLNDQLPPTMLSAVRNNDTQITVTLSENCTDIAKPNSGGFTVAQTGTPTTPYAVTAIAQGTTANLVVLTVADMGVSAKEGVNVTYTAGGNGTVKDTSINTNAMATNSTGVAIAAWDTTPPAISSGALEVNNTYIDVSMSEGVYATDNGTGGLTLSAFALTFTQNGGTATGVSISSVKKPDNALEASASALSGEETVVRVFLNITGTPSGIETIEIKPANTSAIYDKAGNAMLTTQTTGAKTLNDKLPPTMLSAVRNSNTQMTVTLSENCMDITKANDGGFTVEQTGLPSLKYAVTAIAQGATANQVVLTVEDMSFSGYLGVTLKYTTGGNGTIKDGGGNLVASFTTAFSAWLTSNSGGGSTIKENDNKASVIIGGESHDDVMNVETGKTNDGRTEATITLNDKTKDVIDNKPDGTSFKITFPSDYDINNLVMIGDIVKKMEEKSIVLDITANSSTFALPAADIKIDDVAKSFGDNVALKDITVKITISTPDANMSTEITKKAEEGGFSIVAPAVDFAINCTYKNNTVAITEFDSYVQNTTKLPDEITPEKITTAIYTSKDGEFHHVPTKITIIDGVYYAVVNSMISGTFNFVYHPVGFPDVENHWSKAVVNDMASRFIVYGYESGLYIPDGDITRAEFAAIVIRAMGLPKGMGTNTFTDVPANEWYCGYVSTACKYGLINGYSPEEFGPNDKITREQAITIIARMMKKVKYDVSLAEEEKGILFEDFKDKTDISDYAKDSIAICIKSEIVVGRGETTDEGISESTIKPKAFLTRAEAAALVQRVLSKSGLI